MFYNFGKYSRKEMEHSCVLCSGWMLTCVPLLLVVIWLPTLANDCNGWIDLKMKDRNMLEIVFYF